MEVLLSCMYETDDTLVRVSKITGDAIVISQGDWEGYREFGTKSGMARMFFSRERGLTKSRNMAIRESNGNICLLCDDDEVFVDGYEERILEAYRKLPQADVIIFKMINRTPSFPDKVRPLRFPQTMKVSSWQISFRRERILEKGIWFDELLGAGTGNGGEEELKFLTDCEKAALRIYYVPTEIAQVSQTSSTWFNGFTERFFENRGATTRYILGLWVASFYAVYYIVRKRRLYRQSLAPSAALKATFRGIRGNKIGKQAKASPQKILL